MRIHITVLTAALLLSAVNVPSSRAALSPCAQLDSAARGAEPALGHGVTLATGVAGNYFPADVLPRLELDAGPGVQAGSQLSYRISDRTTVRSQRSLPVPAESTYLPLPNLGPGFFELQAILTAGGVELGGTCIRYGVGMSGARLNLEGLPAQSTATYGDAVREVEINGRLGFGLVRHQLQFTTFLRNPTYYDNEMVDAAAAAARYGITLEYQVGQGDPNEIAAVNDGTWESKIYGLVSRRPGTVKYWEAWNEPSWKYPGTPADFVHRVLEPFTRAVHAADPTAKVVGGSMLAFDSTWWSGFAKAGGFRALDVVGVHPYGGCGGFDADGTVGDLMGLIGLKDANGGRGKPLWDTESSWQSSGACGAWRQADNVARKLVWERVLGMKTAQFLSEGGYQDWSIIDYQRGVKPAAVAATTFATVMHRRTFWKMIPTNVPHVRAALFRPADSSRQTLTVLWTDNARQVLKLAHPHLAYTMTGQRLVLRGTIPVNSQVLYLVNPRGNVTL